jgi:arylsulfatase A
MKKLLSVSTVILSALSCVFSNAEKPNIVFILADDLGYGDVRAYNSESKIVTPHLDKLAAEGMRFTDAHSGGSTCVPSRYALLNGRFAVREELQVREGPTTPEGQMTIASLLQSNGYETTMVGKWHQGFDMVKQKKGPAVFDYSKPITGGPVDRGFDSYFGMHASLDIPPYFYIRGRMVTAAPTETVEAKTSEGSPEGWNRIQGAFWRSGPIGPDFVHEEVTPRFLQEAKQVITDYASKDSSKPLFLYLALPSPHTPWLPTKAFQGKSKVGMYGDFVMQVDATVGGLLITLEDSGLTEDTLVIFSSDNGPVWYDENTEHFGHSAAGPLRGKKATLWEGAHRVPFIIRWPGSIQAGSTNEHTVSFVDVFATFAELVSKDTSRESSTQDSVSFLPALFGKDLSNRPPIIHDTNSIRKGDWKLILPRKGKRASNGELYNLKKDLGETNNLYTKRPKLVERLSTNLKTIVSE